MATMAEVGKKRCPVCGQNAKVLKEIRQPTASVPVVDEASRTETPPPPRLGWECENCGHVDWVRSS